MCLSSFEAISNSMVGMHQIMNNSITHNLMHSNHAIYHYYGITEVGYVLVIASGITPIADFINHLLPP